MENQENQTSNETISDINPEELAIKAMEDAADENEIDASENAQEALEGEKEQATSETQAQEKTAPEDTKTQLWGKITAQDKQIRELKQQLKSANNVDSLKDLGRKDPAKLFDMLGIGVDQVLDVIAQQQGIPQQQTEKQQPKEIAEIAEIAALKEEIKQLRSHFEEQKQVSAVNQEINHITSIIKSNPGRWESIEATKNEGSIKTVLDTAIAAYNQYGKVIEYEEILDTVEEHIYNELLQRYENMKSIKKLNASQPPPQQKQQVSSSLPKRTPPIVNPNSATTIPKEMSEEEKIQYAIDLLNKG